MRNHYFIDAAEFIRYFKLEREFLKQYGHSISYWEKHCFIDDMEIISFFLNKMQNKFILLYDEDNTGSFSVLELTN